MANVLTRKLEIFGPLSEEDRRFLDGLVRSPRVLRAREDIIQEGDAPDSVHLITEGLAFRYKVLEDGKRQIMAFLVAGDLCDYHVFILKAMDHSIATMSECRIVEIPRSAILEMLTRPSIARALWWATLVDEATLREWLVNMGQRNADERIAHFFCEMHLRLRCVGLTDDGHFLLPITQSALADTMGISAVHVNRTLQRLRRERLLTFKGNEVVIDDLDRLREMSGFNPNYLHLEGGKHDRAATPRRV